MIAGSYKYPNTELVSKQFRLSLAHRFRQAADEVRYVAKPKANLKVWPASGSIRALKNGEMPLVVLTNNSRRFVPSFLKHYRALGVHRFLVVDDKSTDGTREYLEGQPDVDVFFSNVRYADAHRGRAWREELFQLHGVDRWYLNVDCDEYLVFDSFENRTLEDLTTTLERRSIYRLAAPMVDCYPPGKINNARFDGETDVMPWKVASIFDASGYNLKVGRRALSVEGGVRVRVFGAVAELMKYPLVFWKRGYSLATSIHQPAPFKYNFGPIHAALLHFKFFDDIAARAQEAISDNQYYDGSREYRRIAMKLQESSSHSFECAMSTPFIGSKDMMERGFFAPIFENEKF